MSEAGGLEDIYQNHKDEGFMLVEVMVSNTTDGAPPTVEGVNQWVGDYGMTFPVLRDEDGDPNLWTYCDGGLPTKVLVDHGEVIAISHADVQESDIEKLLAKHK